MVRVEAGRKECVERGKIGALGREIECRIVALGVLRRQGRIGDEQRHRRRLVAPAARGHQPVHWRHFVRRTMREQPLRHRAVVHQLGFGKRCPAGQVAPGDISAVGNQ